MFKRIISICAVACICFVSFSPCVFAGGETKQAGSYQYALFRQVDSTMQITLHYDYMLQSSGSTGHLTQSMNVGSAPASGIYNASALNVGSIYSNINWSRGLSVYITSSTPNSVQGYDLRQNNSSTSLMNGSFRWENELAISETYTFYSRASVPDNLAVTITAGATPTPTPAEPTPTPLPTYSWDTDFNATPIPESGQAVASIPDGIDKDLVLVQPIAAFLNMYWSRFVGYFSIILVLIIAVGLVRRFLKG